MIRGLYIEGSIVRLSTSGGSPLPYLRSGLGLGSNRYKQFPKETSKVVLAKPLYLYYRASETGLIVIELGCIYKKGAILKSISGIASCKQYIL
jgi:hypothetical protein